MTDVVVWLAHSLVISGILAAAAASWELSARWSARPARWAWLAALAGSVTVPWLVRLVPATAWPEALPSAVPILSLEPIVVGGGGAAASAAAAGPGAVAVALALWATTSALALLVVAAVVLRLRVSRREWRETELDGERVYVTRDEGPAAVGLRRGVVLLPGWALELSPDLRRLLLRHEGEHVRAGDPRLLFAGLVLLALMPWNPLAWLQLVRLRNAIELDCDARVLAAGADPRRYGALLLEVGRHRAGPQMVMATFAEPHAFLEARIRRIARWPAERRPRRAAALAVLALALGTTALSARDPLRPAGAGEGGGLRAASAIAGGPLQGALPGTDAPLPPAAPGTGAGFEPAAVDTPPPPPPPPTRPVPTPQPSPAARDTPISARPTFTPMTVRPELQNMRDVQRALEAEYPPLLRNAGIGGQARVWFFIDEEGQVQRTQISASSGVAELDSAALRVSRVMQFSPAFNRDQPVQVWVEIPVIFTPRVSTVIPQGEGPGLRNLGELIRATQENYPPVLSAAGIGGTAVVAVYVDTDGVVQRMQIRVSSGHDPLDAAALQVAGMARFERSPEPGWRDMTVLFRPRPRDSGR
jgi:TonB family protein